MTTIVVGVNNQATALAAFTRAKSLAQLTDADLHLVYAITVGDTTAEATARRHAEGLLESLALASGRPVAVHVVAAKPHEAILQVASKQHADLVVIGNKGLTKRGRFTREVPAMVLRHATCSVLVVDTASGSLGGKDSSPSQPFG